ncbi:hypothetical protein MMC10_008114 [Thelotrema lepadinum]|nr:hypothetical protein [Thelotrema lepadinum]
MATITITRPAYKLSRSSSFENAIPSLPPYDLAPRRRNCTNIVEQAVLSLQPTIGRTLVETLLAVLKSTTTSLEKLRQDCTWHFFNWLFNPNAILLVIFWPGWIIVAVAYLFWRQ